MIYDYPFQSHYVNIAGNRLHYVDEGDGPVIVMLHGNPTWSFYYRNLVKSLSANFRVIVPDHMGCGFSDKPETYDYSLANHIKNVEVLLDHLSVEKYSLVVHDWGGAIGFGYAIKHLDGLQRIVVLNTAAFRSKRIPFRIRICRWPFIGPLIVRGFNGFAWPATFMAVTKPMPEEIAKTYLTPYNSWKNRVAVNGFVRDIQLSENHPSYLTLRDIEQGLKNISEKNIRMLVIWGGKDFCFNDHFFKEWKSRFPGAEFHYLDDAGHYVLEDGHGVVEPLIGCFFQEMTD